MIRNVFVCTDTSKLYDLGFVKYQDVLLYETNGQHRIWIYPKRNNTISFVHHNFDTYNMFKKMCELNIVEVETIHSYNNSKIEELEKRIAELESRLSLNEA